MDDLEKLKPCPFCGGEAFVQPQQGDNPKPFAWDIIHHCGNVGFIRMYPRNLDHCSTKEQAIAAWNSRASDAAILVAEKALREARDELDAYYLAEYGSDHPYHVRKLSVAKDGNPARTALSEIEKLTGGGE